MKVAVIGAGPVGLYAAHQLVKEGHEVVLFERAAVIAGHVRSWGFVRLFSPVELNVPTAVRQTLQEQGSVLPPLADYLTGDDFAAQVLEPLSKWLLASGRCEVRLEHEILSIGRGRFLKSDAVAAMGDKRRAGKPFRLLCRRAGGAETTESGFLKVIDASGSYGAATGNWVGVGGMIAPGEREAEAAGQLRRVIPDVKGADKEAVAGRRIAIIGTGASAITALRNLFDLARDGAGAPAAVFWLTRCAAGKDPYSILENDPLPQRKELARFGNELAAAAAPCGSTAFEYVPAMAVGAVERQADGALRLSLELGEEGETERQIDVDMLYSLTGFHPNKEIYSELQVHTCYASDGPMKLAASLLAAKMAASGGDSAAAGDCLKQAAPGKDTLLNPEPDFYIIGMKSYGRNSAFLMRVGYEQVDLLMEELRQTAGSAL